MVPRPRRRGRGGAGAPVRTPCPHQRCRPRRPLHACPADAPTASIAALAILADAAQAAAPGWSTPHTVTPYRAGTYAAGANGQAVQLFANGAVQTMTAQIRAIKSDATQGSAVGVNSGAAGSTGSGSRSTNGRLVAAWTIDPEGTHRSASPPPWARAPRSRRRRAVFRPGPERGRGRDRLDATGNGVVAWIQSPQSAPGPTTVKAATLRPGLAPQIATLDTRGQREPRLPLARSRQHRATHGHVGREPRRRDRSADRRRPRRRHGRVRTRVRGADRDGGDRPRCRRS